MQKTASYFLFLVGWTNSTLSISSSHILNLAFWGQRVDTIGTSHQISLLLLDAKLDLFWPSVSPFIPLARCLSYSSEDVANVFVCMVGDLLIVEESYTLGSVSFKLTSFSPEWIGFVLSSAQKGLVSFVSNGLHSYCPQRNCTFSKIG